MTDLASLIEAGDFRRFAEAENLVADFAGRFLLRQRGLALSQLDDDLGRLDSQSSASDDPTPPTYRRRPEPVDRISGRGIVAK